MPMTDEEIQQFVTRTVQGAITAAVNPLGDQMRGISTALEGLRPAAPAAPATPAVPVTPAPATPAVPVVDPALNSQMLEMRRSNEKLVADMATLTKAREADQKRADDAERMSVVNTALGGFQFATDAARQTAVEKIMPQIKRTDTGVLVAGENLTPEAFIKDFLPTQHAYLLAPVNASGSGVTPGNKGGMTKAVDLDSIRPGMSAEDRAAAVAAIVQAGASLHR